jgi:cytochrome c oxidase assembly protein Cox11
MGSFPEKYGIKEKDSLLSLVGMTLMGAVIMAAFYYMLLTYPLYSKYCIAGIFGGFTLIVYTIRKRYAYGRDKQIQVEIDGLITITLLGIYMIIGEFISPWRFTN